MFVADVGGTNIRLAVAENQQISTIRKYLCADFASIEDAILHFQKDVKISHFDAACIAIACPVNNDLVKMTNHTWSFSKSSLKSDLQLHHLDVINDYTAIAHSLPVLAKHQVIQVGQGEATSHGNIAVFGPGTGLGVEHLTWKENAWHTLDGEGGHVDFAPTDDGDVIIWRYLHKKFGRASAEEALSGRGIVNIYRAFCEDAGATPNFSKAAEISHAAVNGDDANAYRALSHFCQIMGSFAGNLALNLCTTGGVFIGGGITSQIQDFFIHSRFREKFEAKGGIAYYVKNIPN